jgi:hypothetical protein
VETNLELQRTAVSNILVALEGLSMEERRLVLWRLAMIYGRPGRRRKRKRPQDPSPDSPEGSFSAVRIGVFGVEVLARAA